MSSAGQATSSSTSNSQLIIDALADYTKITGIDLSKNSFTAELELSNSPHGILQLLQERVKAFEEYRDGNRRLISCLSPTVKVIQAFSGTFGEVGGLVSVPPVNALFVGIDVLLAAASGVSSSYDALLELFDCLGNVFKRLDIYTTIPLNPIMTEVIVKIMLELLSVLALASKQMKQGRFKKFAKYLLRESEIEAVLQRLDRLTQDEARITVAQTLGVIHGLVGSVKVVMEDGKAPTDSIRQDLVALHKMLNEMNKSKRDQLQRDVQHWLSPPDPSKNHDFVWKAHHTGTSAWFFESRALAEWKASGSLLWMHGKPGSGKSTLLSAIIEEIEGMHTAGLATMAYYYFDFRDVKKQDRYGLLSSLISQLSAESDSCYNTLSQLFSNHDGGTRKPTTSALTKCMKDMLSLPGQGPIYIIVDAVDECPNFPGWPSAREGVLELIEELVDLKLPNLHLCVASRPEIDIRTVLEPLTTLNISLHDERGQKEDIIKYIKSVVRSDRNMRRWKEEDQRLVVDTLSDKSDGMFRWVVCQVERLCRTFPVSIRSVLEMLPNTLDETYSRALLRIDEEKREYAQRLFRCLAVSIRPLRVEELAEVLAIRFSKAAPPTFNAAWRPENAEEAILSVCASLISILDMGRNQIVQFSHFSVKEYLTSERLATAEERLSYYHILPEPAHTVLAHASLSVLLQLDDKIDRNTITHFPLAPYAARHWVDHAQFKNVSEHVQEAMKRLFDPSKPHFAAWVWLYDIDRHWIAPMSTIHPTRSEAVPLYYASLCGLRGLMVYCIASYSADLNSRGGSHRTPLHAASVKGHLGVATVLLERGADPNSRDKQGRAPLHRVSQGGHLVMPHSTLEIARVLVSSGADVNVTDNQGRTPLHAAARSGYLDLVQLLHESGASLHVWDEDRETPLHLACGYGKLDIARFLIDCGLDVNSQDKNGCIPLQIASRFGHVDVARRLLDCGSGVNVRDTQRWTPLHYASRYGRLDLARLLVDHGANVNVHGVDHWTPLHLASHSGHLDIAKLLVNHGADVNSRKDKQETSLDLASRIGHLEIARVLIENGAELSTRDEEGWTPFHTASYFGHLHVAKFLLESGIDVDIRNGKEETSLYLASSSGKVDVVRFLIEQGADIHVRDKSNWNPVHIASHNGYLDVVHLLIETGAHVDILNGTQETPLALASREGKVEVGRFLIEQGADLNARDKLSRSPFHLATQDGHLNMARLLLDHGVDPNIQKDNLWSALHLASAHGHLRVAELLVQRGARVDVSNGKKETPLHLAAGNGKVEIARVLVDHGATLRTANNNGWTPLHSAARHGHLGVVKLLLQRGASVDALNKANKTAATVASENGQAEIAKFIFQYKPICPATLDVAQYGADEDGKVEGNASLHTASVEGRVDVVKFLLEQGSNINARIARFRTPLHVAAVKGKLEVVDLLIERGAEVDPCDMWGWVPLHLAARFGHLEVSRVLIDHGANVNARNEDHWTPIHLSAANGHLGIVKLLLERGADVHAVNGEGEIPYQISQAFGYGEIADLLRAW